MLHFASSKTEIPPVKHTRGIDNLQMHQSSASSTLHWYAESGAILKSVHSFESMTSVLATH
jgi:hypothetical protein